MDNSAERKKYDATAWRHLLSDETMHEFRQNYYKSTHRKSIPSDTWVKNTIKSLDSDNSTESIYNDLFSDRLVPGTNCPESTTYPRLIAWEISAILKAILEVRDENKNVRGIDFASQVFDKLIPRLIELPYNRQIDDYITLHYLNNEGIQQKMLMRFEDPFNHRLQLIHDFVFNPHAGVNLDNLVIALQQLDLIILNMQSEVTHSSLTYASELETLYNNLLSIRRELLTEQARKDGDINTYHWQVTPKTKDLVSKMIELLKSTSRQPNNDEVSAFLDVYNKYLVATMESPIKLESEDFIRKYGKLNAYLFRKENTDEFKESITKELREFAQSLFNDLNYMDTIGYPYSSYTPAYAASAYAGTKLADVHTNILLKIHNPLRLLRVSYSFLFFTKDGVCLEAEGYQKIQQVSQLLLEQIQKLSAQYPDFPSPANTPPHDFATAYAERVCAIMKKESVDEMMRTQIQTSIQLCYHLHTEDFKLCSNCLCGKRTCLANLRMNDYRIKQFHSAAFLLLLECKMVVAYEIEIAIQKLMDEYCKITNVLSKYIF